MARIPILRLTCFTRVWTHVQANAPDTLYRVIRSGLRRGPENRYQEASAPCRNYPKWK